MTNDLEFIELINWTEKRMASKQIKALSENKKILNDKVSNLPNNQNELYIVIFSIMII